MKKRTDKMILVLIAMFIASNMLFVPVTFADCDAAAIELHSANKRLIGRLDIHIKISEDQKDSIEDVQKIIRRVVTDKKVTPQENQRLLKASVTLVQKKQALLNSNNRMNREIGTWFSKINALQKQCD